MLCQDGSVKVLDFGLAMFHDPELSKLTRTGTALGSPAYMSPEQIRGAAVGPQSDFYSLGLAPSAPGRHRGAGGWPAPPAGHGLGQSRG
jgi:serine/threonine protein kinase